MKAPEPVFTSRIIEYLQGTPLGYRGAAAWLSRRTTEALRVWDYEGMSARSFSGLTYIVRYGGSQ